MSETVMDVLGEYNLPFYAPGHGLTKLAGAFVEARNALATRERELAASRTMLDVLREEARIYREQRDAVTTEMATLREDAARLEGALVTYHHAFVTDNKPPVAAQMVAREYARKQRADIARAQEARDDA